MHKSTLGERVTAMISTLVAVAILGAAVAAQQARTPGVDRLASLESDLRFQLDLAWRHDQGQLKSRLAALDETLVAFRRSPQSPQDEQLLTQWLRKSIVRSMPGESDQLPAAPKFGADQRTGQRQTRANSNQEKAVSGQGPRVPGANASALQSPQVNARKASPVAPSPRPAESNPANTSPSRVAAKPPLLEPIAEIDVPVIDAPIEAPATESTPAPTSVAEAATSLPEAPAEKQSVTPAVAPPASAPATASKTAQAASSSGRPADQSITVRKVPINDSNDPDAATAPKAQSTALAAKTANAAKATQPKPAAKPIQLNLAELNARIGGYHDGLDEIAAAIVAERDSATPEKVARLVRKVEQLAEQYRFVRLYYDSLADSELLFVMAPRPMEATLEMVDQERRRVEPPSDSDFLQPSDAENEKLADSELGRRLQAVAKSIAE